MSKQELGMKTKSDKNILIFQRELRAHGIVWCVGFPIAVGLLVLYLWLKGSLIFV